MSDNKLVLHPIDPSAILQDPQGLLEALRQLGLIGTSFHHLGELHYKAGRRFGELVPRSATAPPPPAEAEDPHVTLAETTATPVFLGGGNAQAPLCPGCEARFEGWRQKLQDWQAAPHESWTCARCGRRRLAHELDWGRRAGFARYALDIWSIHEDEAVPSAELMETLRVVSYADWTYFYYRFP